MQVHDVKCLKGAEEWLLLAGLATQAVPLYLSEIAPVHIRGQLNIMFQLSITIGILAAQIINYCACTPVASRSTAIPTCCMRTPEFLT